MKQSLVKLVDVIIRKLQEHPERPPTERGLRSWLVGQGYSKRDIDAALKLVQTRFIAPEADADERVRTVRLFSAFEELKMTREARNALVRLALYGLIEPYEMEAILDRLGHFEGEVGLPELDYLLAWTVLSDRDVEFQQTVFNVLEGKPDTLH